MEILQLTSSTIQALIATTVIAGLTTLGGLWIASRRPSWYNQERLSLFIAIGTGMLLAITFLEFLPNALENSFSHSANHSEHAEHSFSIEPYLILLGLFSIIFMEVVIAPRLKFLDERFGNKYNTCHQDHGQTYGEKHHEGHHHHEPAAHSHHVISHQAACSALGCLLVCAFFDGVQLQSAFLLSTNTGWITSAGLFFHTLPDGVLAASIALAGGLSSYSAKFISILTGIVIFIGVLTALFLKQIVDSQSYILAFSSGVLLYVSLMHLLPVGLKHRHGLFWMFIGAGSLSTVFFFL